METRTDSTAGATAVRAAQGGCDLPAPPRPRRPDARPRRSGFGYTPVSKPDPLPATRDPPCAATTLAPRPAGAWRVGGSRILTRRGLSRALSGPWLAAAPPGRVGGAQGALPGRAVCAAARLRLSQRPSGAGEPEPAAERGL